MGAEALNPWPMAHCSWSTACFFPPLRLLLHCQPLRGPQTSRDILEEHGKGIGEWELEHISCFM